MVTRESGSGEKHKNDPSGSTDPRAEEATRCMKEVYDRGINIYMMINRTKKELKRVDHFPPEVIIGVCKDYTRQLDTGKVNKTYPYFIRLLKAHSSQWHANQQIQESKKYDKRSKHIPSAISDILKGMGNGS